MATRRKSVRTQAATKNRSSNSGRRRPAAESNPEFERYCRATFDPRVAFGKPEALKGMRVLSCSQYILGPSCAAYLGELGAEVIRIEAPRRGEPMRHSKIGRAHVRIPVPVKT